MMAVLFSVGVPMWLVQAVGAGVQLAIGKPLVERALLLSRIWVKGLLHSTFSRARRAQKPS